MYVHVVLDLASNTPDNSSLIDGKQNAFTKKMTVWAPGHNFWQKTLTVNLNDKNLKQLVVDQRRRKQTKEQDKNLKFMVHSIAIKSHDRIRSSQFLGHSLTEKFWIVAEP